MLRMHHKDNITAPWGIEYYLDASWKLYMYVTLPCKPLWNGCSINVLFVVLLSYIIPIIEKFKAARKIKQ